MIKVIEEIRLTVHNTIVFMAMQLTTHLEKSLQSNGTHKFKKKDKIKSNTPQCPKPHAVSAAN